MNVILYDNYDCSSKEYIQSLMRNVSKPLVSIDLEELIRSEVTIYLDDQDETKNSFEILTPKGAIIESSKIDIFFNLISNIPPDHFNHFKASDRNYLSQEWSSIFICLMNIVQNKCLLSNPYPYELAGAHFTFVHWIDVLGGTSISYPKFYIDSMHNYVDSIKSRTPELNLVVYNQQIFLDSNTEYLLPESFKKEVIQIYNKTMQKFLSLKIRIQLSYIEFIFASTVAHPQFFTLEFEKYILQVFNNSEN